MAKKRKYGKKWARKWGWVAGLVGVGIGAIVVYALQKKGVV